MGQFLHNLCPEKISKLELNKSKMVALPLSSIIISISIITKYFERTQACRKKEKNTQI